MALIGDTSEGDVYRAVGYALSCWETIEVELADIYSVFVGRPFGLAGIEAFGDENSIFAARCQRVEQAAKAYFVRFCDQANEGDIAALLHRTRHASSDRHAIAHGLVQCVQMIETDTEGRLVDEGQRWVLLSPWYARRRLRRVGHDGWGSLEILDCAFAFTEIKNELASYLQRFVRASR